MVVKQTRNEFRSRAVDELPLPALGGTVVQPCQASPDASQTNLGTGRSAAVTVLSGA